MIFAGRGRPLGWDQKQSKPHSPFKFERKQITLKKALKQLFKTRKWSGPISLDGNPELTLPIWEPWCGTHTWLSLIWSHGSSRGTVQCSAAWTFMRNQNLYAFYACPRSSSNLHIVDSMLPLCPIFCFFLYISLSRFLALSFFSLSFPLFLKLSLSLSPSCILSSTIFFVLPLPYPWLFWNRVGNQPLSQCANSAPQPSTTNYFPSTCFCKSSIGEKLFSRSSNL